MVIREDGRQDGRQTLLNVIVPPEWSGTGLNVPGNGGNWDFPAYSIDMTTGVMGREDGGAWSV